MPEVRCEQSRMSRTKPELRVEWRKRDTDGHRDPALPSVPSASSAPCG